MTCDDPGPGDDLLEHVGFVRTLARAALRGDPESEDLAQEALLAGATSAPEGAERKRSWFAAVVRNRAVDFLRRRTRRVARERAAARPEAQASAAAEGPAPRPRLSLRPR